MKNIHFLALAVLSIALTACGNKTSNNIYDQMVRVKGGTFRMGDELSRENDFGSSLNNHRILYYGIEAHTVSLSDFYVGKYEVTQKEWTAIMGSNPSNFKGDDLPVENVSWNDCQEFIRKLNSLTGKNYRLPTEAEWEYVAQMTNNSDWDDACWYNENSRGTTHPVGSKSPNILGIYDIWGNVSEWCQDWYEKDYYYRSPKSNPTGTVKGTERVYRGQSFDDGLGLGSTYTIRHHNEPNFYHPTLGFRLAISCE